MTAKLTESPINHALKMKTCEELNRAYCLGYPVHHRRPESFRVKGLGFKFSPSITGPPPRPGPFEPLWPLMMGAWGVCML